MDKKENLNPKSTSSTNDLRCGLIQEADLKSYLAQNQDAFHQVFSGRRMPSRDRLLCLCISMGADLEQTQKILRQAAYGYLYPRHKRDAIICHGIVHHTPLTQINDNLFSANEKTLF